MSKPYAQLLTTAEAAVEKVKDPELRRIAFERVLNDLLNETADDIDGRREPSQAKSVVNKGGRQSRKTKNSSKRAVGPHAYVNELAKDGFFKKPKSIGEVKSELENQGHHIP